MMSLDNNIGATKPGTHNKDGTHTSGGGGGGKKSSSSMRPPPEQAPPPPPALKCPRCDSPNTKFCYYNNYSLTQPRHFCKTCRRYWTKGGALRNVPIGGGCRKNKKMKSSSNSSSSSSRFSGDSSSSCSDIGGLKFFNGLSPAMDFQLGGLNLTPRTGNLFNNTNNSQFSLFGGPSSSCFNLDPLGFNNGLGFQEMGNSNISPTSNLTSSIESLSCINQDLHWKLQQQRLAMLFGGGGGSGGGGGEDDNQHKNPIQVLDHDQNDHQGQKLLQPILFQNLEISPKAHHDHQQPPMGDSGKDCGGSRGGDDGGSGSSLATEWFFENCYAPVNNPAPTTSNSAGGNDQNGNNNWNGIQAWSNLNQYSALP